MLSQLFESFEFATKNILILGSARSGTHPLAAMIAKHDPSLNYIGERGMMQQSQTPWQDFDLFTNNQPRKLAHIVQPYSKLFYVGTLAKIKNYTLIVALRRRNKIKQFASWMYFKHIGQIYNFQHNGQDYLPPGSITVTMSDIENFIFEQVIDTAFNPDYTFYYEDLNLSHSRVKKNQYTYPIEQIFSNLDLVEQWLGSWKYNE